jgi:type III pantothenate kinase
MLLAIDCGNTNTVFAVYDGERKLANWRATTEQNRTADEYGVWLLQLIGLEGLQREQIDAAIIASVVPATTHQLVTLCRRYFGAHPLVVGDPAVDLGMQILIDRPEQVGADRLVNSVAAYARYGGPLLVLDFGTATTFDLIDADGNYCGSIIAPGVNLSAEALYMAAAQLPRVVVERPAKVIGRATVPAMQSGLYWGYVGMIEGLIARAREEFGQPVRVVATGGLANLFAETIAAIEDVDGDLTLRGLLLVWQRNQHAGRGAA